VLNSCRSGNTVVIIEHNLEWEDGRLGIDLGEAATRRPGVAIERPKSSPVGGRSYTGNS